MLVLAAAALIATGVPSAHALGAHIDSGGNRQGGVAGELRVGRVQHEVLLQSLLLIGVEYRFGGNHPEAGRDCSALVRLVMASGAGIAVPRNTAAQARVGKRVQRSRLQPGDLVFFNTRGRRYSHVGVYIGEDRFIHAPSSGQIVRIESMRARYWSRRFSGARRVIGVVARTPGLLAASREKTRYPGSSARESGRPVSRVAVWLDSATTPDAPGDDAFPFSSH